MTITYHYGVEQGCGGDAMSYTPGPGDSETWPMFAGHPHDPRTPEDDSNDTAADSIIAVSEYMLHAFIAYRSGNHAEYDRILREAAAAISEMIGQKA